MPVILAINTLAVFLQEQVPVLIYTSGPPNYKFMKFKMDNCEFLAAKLVNAIDGIVRLNVLFKVQSSTRR